MKKNSFLLIALLLSKLMYSQVIVKGSVSSITGLPLKRCDVYLTSTDDAKSKFLMPLKPLATKTLTPDGKFEFSLANNEPFCLFITGVHHQPYWVLIQPLKQKTLSLDIKLATHNIVMNTSGYKIFGNFNNYALSTAIPLNPSGHFTYSTTLSNLPKDTIYYLLTEVSKKHTVSGQERNYKSIGPDKFAHEGYVSMAIADKGEKKITIDLSAFPVSPLPPVFSSGNNTINRINQIANDMEELSNKAIEEYSKHFEAGMQMETFNFRPDTEMTNLEKALKTEKSPVIMQVLLIAYLDAINNYMIDGNKAKCPSWVANLALKSIPPDSKLWGLRVGLIELVTKGTSDQKIAEQYLKTIYTKSSIDKAKALSLLLQIQLKVAEKKDYNDLFDTLTIRFSKTSYAYLAKEKYAKGGNPLIGKKLPSFTIENLKEKTKPFTESSFSGKYVLIDFWATWCIPCIREIPGLEKAYTKFSAKGLTILSVSMDISNNIAEKFFTKREKEFEWASAIEKKEFKSEIAKALEISAIPFIILVGPDGKILEVNESLRGEKLITTLEKYFK